MVLHFIAKATFLNNHQKNILPKCISGGLNTKSPALNNTRISLKTCLLQRMFVTSPPQDIIPLQPCSYFIADWKLHPYTSGNFPGGHFSHFMSVRCGNQLTKTWTFYRPLFVCEKFAMKSSGECAFNSSVQLLWTEHLQKHDCCWKFLLSYSSAADSESLTFGVLPNVAMTTEQGVWFIWKIGVDNATYRGISPSRN